MFDMPGPQHNLMNKVFFKTIPISLFMAALCLLKNEKTLQNQVTLPPIKGISQCMVLWCEIQAELGGKREAQKMAFFAQRRVLSVTGGWLAG